MEKRLKALFGFQRFHSSSRLAAMLEEAEKRYTSLSDDDLAMVSAAGERMPAAPLKRKEPLEHG